MMARPFMTMMYLLFSRLSAISPLLSNVLGPHIGRRTYCRCIGVRGNSWGCNGKFNKWRVSLHVMAPSFMQPGLASINALLVMYTCWHAQPDRREDWFELIVVVFHVHFIGAPKVACFSQSTGSISFICVASCYASRAALMCDILIYCVGVNL